MHIILLLPKKRKEGFLELSLPKFHWKVVHQVETSLTWIQASQVSFMQFERRLLSPNLKILLTSHLIYTGILDPADSCQEKYETCVRKELAQGKDLTELDRSTSDLQNPPVCFSIDTALIANRKEVEDGSKLNNNINWKHDGELQDVLIKIVAQYVHPMPILVVLLTTVGNDLYLCLICGSLAQENKILFVYNSPINGETAGCPSFVGHSSVILPLLKDSFGRKVR